MVYMCYFNVSIVPVFIVVRSECNVRSDTTDFDYFPQLQVSAEAVLSSMWFPVLIYVFIYTQDTRDMLVPSIYSLSLPGQDIQMSSDFSMK